MTPCPPASSAPPRPARPSTPRGWLALDARGGRVLLHRTDEHPGGVLFERGNAASPGIRLAVWDPLSTAAGGGHLELPVPILPQPLLTWNAALLCCDQYGLQDHADRPFRVVLVGTDPDGAFACVYSSLRPAAWSESAYAAQHADLGFVDTVPGALIGNALYFLFERRTGILKYDLATGDISVIQLPPTSHCGYGQAMLCTVLTTAEDGGLGFARVEGDKLCLWSMEARPNGGALPVEWTQGRVIDLKSQLPVIFLLGFADGLGIILVGTIHGRIDKLVDGTDFYNGIVPYVSFYTPALGTTSTDEGPIANA